MAGAGSQLPSTCLDQTRRLVAFKEIEEEPEAPVLIACEPFAALERGLSLLPRARQQAAMDFEPGETEAGEAGLTGAEHVALAPQLAGLLGDAEAVFGFAQCVQPR